MGNLNFTTPQVQQRLAQGYYDDIKVAGYTGTKAQLDAILAKAGVVMKAATASANGDAGLVPAPAKGGQDKYLRGDGTWQTPPNTTYNKATSTADGLMSKDDKVKLDDVAEDAPSDNKIYGRKNAAWAEVAAGGAGGDSIYVLDISSIDIPGSLEAGTRYFSGTTAADMITKLDEASQKKIVFFKMGDGADGIPGRVDFIEDAPSYYSLAFSDSVGIPYAEGGMCVSINASILVYTDLNYVGFTCTMKLSALPNPESEYVFLSGTGEYLAAGQGIVVIIPGAVADLDLSSTSDSIRDAFGSDEAFDRIVALLKNENVIVVIGNRGGVITTVNAYSSSSTSAYSSLLFTSKFAYAANNVDITIGIKRTGSIYSIDAYYNKSTIVRETTISTSTPSLSTGEDGDIWIQYTP